MGRPYLHFDIFLRYHSLRVASLRTFEFDVLGRVSYVHLAQIPVMNGRRGTKAEMVGFGGCNTPSAHALNIPTMPPNLVDVLRIVPVESELAPEVEPVLISKAVSHYVVVVPFVIIDPARDVAKHHI